MIFSKRSLLFLSLSLLARAAPPNEDDDSTRDKCSKTTSLFGFSRGKNSTKPNYSSCANDAHPINPLTNNPGTVDDSFVPYNAYFNGSLTLSWTGQSECAIYNPTNDLRKASLAIGQMIHPKMPEVSRSGRDSNSFWLFLEPEVDSFNGSRPQCASTGSGSQVFTDCPPSIQVRSAGASYWYSQWWQLTATKAGDGYDISGNLSTYRYNANSLSVKVASGCAADPSRRSYGDIALNVWDGMTLTGHISPSKADLTISVASFAVTPSKTLPPFSFSFSGSHWESGAKLNTTGPAPATEGESKIYADAAKAKSDKAATTARNKWLYPVIGVAIVLGLIVAGVLVCCCCGAACAGVKAMGRKKDVEQQQPPAFVQQQQHQLPKQEGYEPYGQQQFGGQGYGQQDTAYYSQGQSNVRPQY